MDFRIEGEAAGVEPSDDFAASANVPCTCDKCQECRAANALHSECLKGHFLASFDADLQRVIEAWDRLPDAVRNAVQAIIGSA